MATITDRILSALKLTPTSYASDQAARAYEAGFNDNGNDEPPSGTLKSYGYRRATTGSLRDFTKMSYDEILDTVWTLYQSNPIAKRALKLQTAHFLGTGPEWSTDDDRTDEVLQSNWDANKLEREIKNFTFELMLFGEQIYPAFVRQTDGRASLGYIDPTQIESIITHPDNAKERWAIVLKAEVGQSAKHTYRVIRIDAGHVEDGAVIEPNHGGLMVTADQAKIQPWEDKLLRANGLTEYTGSALLFQINNVSNQSRGFSELLQAADWLDALDDTLFSVGEREQFANLFGWDVEMEGASPEAIQKRLSEIMANPPRRGSVRVHNDKEKWTLDYPDLKQMGSIETVKAVLTFVVGGLGFPLHWFGFGNDSNRATASAQGDPTWKVLSLDQDTIKEMILDILTFFRDQALIAGTLTGEPGEIKVSMPQMTSKDLTALGTAMTQISQALMVAEQQQWTSKRQAVEVWQSLIQELGIEPENVNELLEAPEAEDMATAQAANAFLESRINGKPNNYRPR